MLRLKKGSKLKPETVWRRTQLGLPFVLRYPGGFGSAITADFRKDLRTLNKSLVKEIPVYLGHEDFKSYRESINDYLFGLVLAELDRLNSIRGGRLNFNIPTIQELRETEAAFQKDVVKTKERFDKQQAEWQDRTFRFGHTKVEAEGYHYWKSEERTKLGEGYNSYTTLLDKRWEEVENTQALQEVESKWIEQTTE